MILLVGLPGSGKSTWALRQGLPVLSSDAMRGTLADDVRDQSIHGRVFASLRYLIRQRVAIGRPVTCVDATHLTRKERKPYFRIRRCQVEAVFFDTPLEICQARNRARDRVVPPEIIDSMAVKMTPPSLEEGFALITVVRPSMAAA
ncbi:MAG: AAA family ATPase [Proteobacteria bacterium]|nr:AAA family ATPase [Pseudomonadota bacterium]